MISPHSIFFASLLLVQPLPEYHAVENQHMNDLLLVSIMEFRNTLKDAPSARFKETYFRWTIGRIGTKKHFSICGKINSKNSYGGYTGWETFHSAWYGLENKPSITIGSGNSISADEICESERGTWLYENDLSPILHSLVTPP